MYMLSRQGDVQGEVQGDVQAIYAHAESSQTRSGGTMGVQMGNNNNKKKVG